MKTVRTKMLALLGAGMVFQVGGCSITDLIGGAFPDGASDLFTTLIGG